MKFLLDGQSSERLLFRKISDSDFNDWLKFFMDANASLHWIEEIQTPEEACTKWYERQFERYQQELGGMNALIEKETGRLVGHAGLLIQVVDNVQELEIAYSLLPEFWGNGYAIESARRLKQFAFENKLATSLISIISVTNAPSQRVAEKNGMVIDRWTIYKQNDVFIYRIHQPSN